MVAADLDEARLSAFAAAARASSLGVLLGAGASVPAGLPDWDELVVRLLIGSNAIDDANAAQDFVRTQDPMLAAEAAREASGDWPGTVRAALYGDGSDGAPLPDPTDLHYATAVLATNYGPSRMSLFTTNFDLLLEDALYSSIGEVDSPLLVAPRASAVRPAEDEGIVVHHLHGLVGDTEDVWVDPILTLNDFGRLAGQSTTWQQTELYSALQRGPLILAGTSFRDVDLRQWLHDIIDDGFSPTVIAAMARQGIQLSPGGLEAVAGAIESQWRAIGVTPVMFDDFGEIAQALKELPFMGLDTYASPRDRLQRLWSGLLEDMAVTQRSHSDLLITGREALRSVLGRDANLTLWIAGGDQDLVRWAAPDRVYRSRDDLRRITAAFDSPWIAGVCMAYDAVIAREPDEVSKTGRWRSVVAAPVAVQEGDSPPVTMAVLSSAITGSLEDTDPDQWVQVIERLANEWSEILSEIARCGSSPIP